MKNKAIKRSDPIPFQVPKSENHALLVRIDELPRFYDHLHYHIEFQITAIVKGDGILYAGSQITSFEEGDVILIGKNVPHLFNSSAIYQTEDSPGIKSVSLFFDEHSFGEQFFNIGELIDIRKLLQSAIRVIKAEGNQKELIFDRILATSDLQKEHLVIGFLEILSQFKSSKKSYLNNKDYEPLLDDSKRTRLNQILDYTFKNYQENITIGEIARIANFSRSQFSYFFKLHTGKTYINFLNMLRIEKATVLLKTNGFSIEQICYEVGFQNVSNFIRQFKKAKKMTPSQYRRSWSIG